MDKARQEFVKLEPNSDPHANEGEPNEQGPISDEKQKQPSGNRSVFAIVMSVIAAGAVAFFGWRSSFMH
ncbi:hypothetical protein [Corynebacterium diphtheriae]|uniref:hypothetical protein n=1 Tax=Corynebacterium diphtheriae TaxID=1717 RepID=UPI0009D69BF2|nr:hypothetical protein [Corynebacterium diphtheriae]OSP99509.1 hypothetical protein B1A63_05585 [Corynebacterium diphtheriae]OSQ00973.1 hypothetical protein B1A62_07525 [Corynebacterium diphtheriae]OSQ08847.1 hypothetical protein B1A60_05590 [Corynebacterium diphtheriae]OSQ12171.1 hypothetical protein B1A58_05620 [Corynebacterium diphtheriae]OWX94646.1 hypothetical protein B1A64_05605 [Corynebacterium diphtheriae]